MDTKKTNLSDITSLSDNDGNGLKIGIVVSKWNENITGALLNGAVNTLTRYGVHKDDIVITQVPGSFELIFGSSQMIKRGVDAVIAIGCVIRGDTPHFDYICQGTTIGLAQLNATTDTPVIYGLITTNDMQQALDRCGGKHGNKGDECAATAIMMAKIKQ